MLYREVQEQAQLLAFADDFWLLFVLFVTTLVLFPLLRRVRVDRVPAAAPRADSAPAALPAE
jgi:hypothetical protein